MDKTYADMDVFIEFIKTIKKARSLETPPIKIVIELFDVAGTVKDVSEAAKKWLSENPNVRRRLQPVRYFPERAIKYEFGVFNFFKHNSSQNVLKEAFYQYRGLGNVCTSGEPDVLYWSLLNEFQAILGFQLSEMPTFKMMESFENTVENCGLTIFFENQANIPEDADVPDLPDRIENFLGNLRSNIILPFRAEYSDTTMYGNIVELSDKIKSLIISHSSAINYLLSPYSSYSDEIEQCLKRIYELYCKIRGIKPYEVVITESYSSEFPIEAFRKDQRRFRQEMKKAKIAMPPK